MGRRFLIALVLSTPLIAFSQSDRAVERANENASFKRVPHAPEIDGGSAILGLTLLGGIIVIVVRKKRKDGMDD